MKLHDLIPNPGAKKERKRKGQGGSAGQGKTAGRGTKGEGSRSGQKLRFPAPAARGYETLRNNLSNQPVKNDDKTRTTSLDPIPRT